MKYMGSKARIAKHILPIILKDRKPEQWYIEPFVGGGNLIDKVQGLRIGSDFNPYVIKALELIRDSPESLPENVSFEQYEDLRMFQPLTGVASVIGFGCSFGARWFEGFARGENRNFMKETRNNAMKQSPFLKGVDLINCSYENLSIPKNSIIYCDPPYVGSKGYATGRFNSLLFWDWVRSRSREGHSVFVSEYEAPKDFYSLWEGEVTTTFSTSKNIKATEKLFIFNDTY